MARITGNQGPWQVYLDVNETSTNTSNNTSTASWSLGIRRTDGGSYPMYGTPTINIYISGQRVHSSNTYKAFSSIGPNGVMIVSGSVSNLPHNDNGTIKSNAASFTWSGSGFSPNSVSGSGTYSTSTIPRKTNCPSLSGFIGSSYNLSLNKKSSSFTSALYVTFGDIKGWLQSDGSLGANRYYFATSSPLITIPTSFYNEFNTPSARGTMMLYTRSGNTDIGSSEGILTVNCNTALCMPKVTTYARDINDKTIELTQDDKNVIQQMSNIKIDFDIEHYSDINDNSATITSILIDGTINVATNLRTVTIMNATKTTYPIAIMNSRGATFNGVIDTTGVVIPYIPLTVRANFYRPEPTTGDITTEYSGNYWSGVFGKKRTGVRNIQIGDSINSDNLSFTFPDNLYQELSEILYEDTVLVETTKGVIKIGLTAGHAETYDVNYESNDGELIQIYSASYDFRTDTMNVNWNYKNLSHLESFLDLGEITKLNSNYNKYINDIFIQSSDGEGEEIDITNTLLLEYQYREKGYDTEWSDLHSLTNYTINDEEFIYDGEDALINYESDEDVKYKNFNYTKSYEFRIHYKDLITEGYTEPFQVTRGIPVYWWDEHDLHISDGDLYIRDEKVEPQGGGGGSTIIYDMTLTTDMSTVVIDNLDLEKDGRIYDIEIVGVSSEFVDVHFWCNDYQSNRHYWSLGYGYSNTSTTEISGNLSSVALGERLDRDYWYYGHTLSPEISTIKGTLYRIYNSNRNNNFIKYNWESSGVWSGRAFFNKVTGINTITDNVTKITFKPSSGVIRNGTRFTIRKRK